MPAVIHLRRDGDAADAIVLAHAARGARTLEAAA